MKNKIQETIERGVEELNRIMIDVSRADGIEEIARTTLKYREALEAHQKDLLDAVVAEVRGRKEEHCVSDTVAEMRQVNKINKALTDIETIINKAIGV